MVTNTRNQPQQDAVINPGPEGQGKERCHKDLVELGRGTASQELCHGEKSQRCWATMGWRGNTGTSALASVPPPLPRHRPLAGLNRSQRSRGLSWRRGGLLTQRREGRRTGPVGHAEQPAPSPVSVVFPSGSRMHRAPPKAWKCVGSRRLRKSLTARELTSKLTKHRFRGPHRTENSHTLQS